MSRWRNGLITPSSHLKHIAPMNQMARPLLHCWKKWPATKGLRGECAAVSPARSFASTSTATASSSRSKDEIRKETEHRFNYNPNPFGDAPDPDHHTYRRVTAQDLYHRSKPPKRVKMLTRDFIDDCLYNPHYGYFPTQATIFDPDKIKPKQNPVQGKEEQSSNLTLRRAAGFDFGKLRNSREFEEEIAQRYSIYEGADEGYNAGVGSQLWHTPVELFKPWYGRAIARYLVSEYKLNLYPYEDLIIYEIGAGNGTLMGDILDYIAEEEPDVYERTRYRIIEISERLQQIQKRRANFEGFEESGVVSSSDTVSPRNHAAKVEVLGGSIFDFERVVPEPCFFLALEVLDNFAHDVVRYSTLNHEPFQCIVSIDSTGDYSEMYEPVQDPLIKRYLELRSRLPETAHRRPKILNPLLNASPLLRKIYSIIPFAPNLSGPEFLPTKQLMLLDVLRDKFPAHRILFSDFSSLPDAIPGANAPVVQTRYEGETVPCTTYLVQPGFFDIFFPTNFDMLREIYAMVMMSKSPSSTIASQALRIPSSSSSPRVSSDFFSPHDRRNVLRSGSGGGIGAGGSGGGIKVGTRAGVGAGAEAAGGVASSRRGLSVLDHGSFLERWGEVNQTQLRDGTNPMVTGYYHNAKFLF